MSWQSKAENFIAESQKLLSINDDNLDLLQFEQACAELIDVGKSVIEASNVETDDNKESEIYQLNAIQFKWSIEVLDLCILIRDILLRISKKDLLAQSQKNKADITQGIGEIKEHYNEILESAVNDTKSSLEKILNSEKQESKREWNHQRKPNKIILEQIDDIEQQMTIIADANVTMKPVVPKFFQYREQLLDYTNSRILKLRGLKIHLRQAIEEIKKFPVNCEKSDLISLSKQIQRVSETIDEDKSKEVAYEACESGVNELQVPVFSRGGELIYKEVNIDKNLQAWVESEVFPKIIDADSDINILYDSSVITLFNTRNKIENLSLAERENYEFIHTQFTTGIENMVNEVDKYLTSLDQTIYKINSRAQSELRIENLYDPQREFLPELSFINMTKLTGQKLWYEKPFWREWKEQAQQWLSNQKVPFLSQFSDDPFQYVESRLIDIKDLDANSLFLKKGFLGRSFYIERKSDFEQLNKAVERWKTGYQGSVLILGKYSSGKSSFMEFINHAIADIPVVQLIKGQSIQVNGRKHNVNSDLGESLNFLSKQSITKPIMVCIDDLETWQTKNDSLYSSIRELVDAISKYGKRIFFVVSTNHFMMSHIERLFDFKSRFSEILEIDKMSPTDIANAIVIRHNATLKDYKPEDNTNLTQKASRVARLNRFNIGASMLDWERYLEGKEPKRSIPIHFSQVVIDHALILRIILANKVISESKLRNALTSSDNSFISEELRKLTGYKIIQRTLDGKLQVNPFLVHEVESSLMKTKSQ